MSFFVGHGHIFKDQMSKKRTGYVTLLKIWSLRALQTVDNIHPVKRRIIPEDLK
jgi:hypothetical protein